jgi:hypothetical protein
MAATNREMLAIFCAIALIFSPSDANASLPIELRAVNTSSGTVLDPKHVLFTGGVGDTVTMNIMALITGHNETSEGDGIIAIESSFLSSYGGVLGDLSARRALLFNWSGSNDDSDSSRFFIAVSRNFFPVYGSAVPVGTLTWTYDQGVGGTALLARPRANLSAGLWIEDGAYIQSGDIAVGPPVQIVAPEPGSTVFIAAILRLGLRRRKTRCPL